MADAPILAIIEIVLAGIGLGTFASPGSATDSLRSGSSPGSPPSNCRLFLLPLLLAGALGLVLGAALRRLATRR